MDFQDAVALAKLIEKQFVPCNAKNYFSKQSSTNYQKAAKTLKQYLIFQRPLQQQLINHLLLLKKFPNFKKLSLAKS